ncbi:MAG: type II secretion system protein [Candidatus Daviesbacteria bacterium]|nr:type II secretion system protein [Candidatus Daviesbacteria bacterium]
MSKNFSLRSKNKQSLNFSLRSKNKQSLRPNGLKGFTLIELLVVIAIIGTLVAVLLPQLSNFNREQVLKNSASDLRSNIRKTQNNASSGLNCNSDGLSTSKWTIKFTKFSSDYIITATCSDGSQIPVSYFLPAGITISRIQLDSCILGNFSPRIPGVAKVIFSNISSAISYDVDGSLGCMPINNKALTTTLKDENTNTTKDVVIEKGGNVY